MFDSCYAVLMVDATVAQESFRTSYDRTLIHVCRPLASLHVDIYLSARMYLSTVSPRPLSITRTSSRPVYSIAWLLGIAFISVSVLKAVWCWLGGR